MKRALILLLINFLLVLCLTTGHSSALEAEGDVFLIRSFPQNAEVYVAPKKEDPWKEYRMPYDEKAHDLELFSNNAWHKGTTPLSLEIEPGNYLIGVEIPANETIANIKPIIPDRWGRPDYGILVEDAVLTFYPNGGLGFAGRFMIIREPPTLKHPDEQNSYEFDNNTLLQFVVKESKIVKVRKVYTVLKKANEQKSLAALFQPRNVSLSQFCALLPQETSFLFDEAKVKDSLLKYKISAAEMPDILNCLHKVGKVVCNGESNRLVVEMVVLNK